MAESINFDRNRVLGRGGFGCVYYGIWNEKPVAVKRIQLNQTNDQEKEEEILQKLNHPNVIKLFHTHIDTDFKYYVLELCSASLDQLFLADDQKKYKGPMPSQDQVLLQLANGLEYIHQKNLVHRDVKPANVLIWTENELVVMKWADFGLSKQVNQRGTHSVSSVKGTFQWMAPEILEMLLNDDQSKIRGTIKSDVFAQGLVFGYFLSNGKHPFGDNPSKIEKNIKKHKIVNIDKIQSPLVRDLIGNMLNSQAKDRMTSSDVVHQLKVIQEVEMKERQTEFFILCQEKNPNLKEMQNLLEKGVDINCTNPQGSTPLLHLLAYQTTINHDHLLEIVEFFTSQRANVNCRNSYGENALLKLCVNYTKDDLIEIIRLFIGHGVDLNCQNKYQENILFYLGQYYYSNANLIDIVRLLIEHGIDICRENEYGFNALPVLCRNYTGDNLIDLVRLFNNHSNNQSKEMALKFLVKYKRKNLMEITQLLTNSGQTSPSNNNLSPTLKRKRE